MIPTGKINKRMVDRLPWVWTGYLLLPTPYHFHQVSRFCSLSLSLTRWRCWFALASWFRLDFYAVVSVWSAFGRPDSIPIQLSVVPTLLAKSAAMYNPIIYQVIDINLPVAKLVVWKPLRRNLWRLQVKFQKLKMNDTLFCFRIPWGSATQDMLPS